jgi:hypothetical protein
VRPPHSEPGSVRGPAAAVGPTGAWGGTSLGCKTYFCMAMQAVRAQPGSESTMVMAPWFGNETASGTDWVGAPAGPGRGPLAKALRDAGFRVTH